MANACHAMAVRFHQGGKLVMFGTGGSSTDAQHVAVEFVHPVIVGKRALPAISLTTDVATVTGVAARDGHGRRSSRTRSGTWPSPPTSRSASPPTGTARACWPGCATATGARPADDRAGRRRRRRDRGQPGRRPPDPGPVRRPADRQGTAGDHVPRALGTGARVLRAARAARAREWSHEQHAGMPRRGLHHLLGHGRGGDGRAPARRRPGRGGHRRRREEEVSVALVRAAVGDTILVHAKEAIAVVGR